LMGVPTGRKNDFDVLDIDGDAGLKWYERNYDAIPQTRAAGCTCCSFTHRACDAPPA
jgi:hypothetical protein